MADLSEYELQRQRNIASNNKRLAELGLEGGLAPKKMKAEPKPKRQRRTTEDPEWKPERTTRVSRTAAATKHDKAIDSEEEDYKELPKPKPLRKMYQAKPAASEAKPEGDQCIVIEAAKTGRSKCRGCMLPLEQGEMRVGMESWMVGRAVIVWQHPACFVQNVAVTIESSGRGSCKQTKERFVAGEAKLSCTAHTTTSHFKPRAVAAQLRRVLSLAECEAGSLKGFATLSEEDARELREGAAATSDPELPEVLEVPSQEAALADEGSGSQPSKGSISRAKGKVCWRFAGHLCYGTLLPAQESKTHCYARTHKGKTKTLTKGASSWWVID